MANIRISKDGQELFTYSNSSGVYHNINYLKEYNGESEKASYEALVNAIAEGKAVLNFETEHASVDIPMTTDMMSRSGNSAELDLGDVPYLLFEDFSDAMDSAHDDDYTASAKTDTNLGGYLLNDYMSLDGWNASRYRIYEGDNIRINVRYQSGAWVVGRYCGRLDTPALKYLKSNTSTTIVFEFKYSFDVPSGYNVDDSKEKKAKYRIGTHTESEGSAIDGVTSGNISDKATIHYTSAGHADGDGGTVSYEMNVNGPSTRIVIFADTDQNSKKIGANSVYYLNIDNIKVYIKQ